MKSNDKIIIGCWTTFATGICNFFYVTNFVFIYHWFEMISKIDVFVLFKMYFR